MRDEGCWDPLVIDIIPVDVPEESMGHDLLRIGRSRSQSHFRLSCEELLQDRDGIARHVDGIEGFVGENGVVDLVFIFTTEW